jgi:hypothetical protein
MWYRFIVHSSVYTAGKPRACENQARVRHTGARGALYTLTNTQKTIGYPIKKEKEEKSIQALSSVSNEFRF